MKVHELIEALQECNCDAEVVMTEEDYYYERPVHGVDLCFGSDKQNAVRVEIV